MPRRHQLGSLRSRFLGAFGIALVPVVLLSWFFQFTLMQNRSSGQQARVIAPLMTSTQDLRDDLNSAILLLDILSDVSTEALDCSDVSTLGQVGVARAGRIYRADGTPTCMGAPLPAPLLDRLGGRHTVVATHNAMVWAARNTGTRIVAVELHRMPVALPDGAVALSLQDGTGTRMAMAGDAFDPGAAGAGLTPTSPASEIVPHGKQSVVRMRVGQSDLLLLTLMTRNHAAPSAWVQVAEAGLMPIGMAIVAMILGGALVHRFALSDIMRLRRDMARFRQHRALPDPDLTNATSRETYEMREAFHDLAVQLVTEENIAQARLDHAEQLQREVFHRVSNNFQIVQSITRLIERGDATSGLRALRARIHMLSAAHHALHRLDAPDLRPVSEALPELARAISVGSDIGTVHVTVADSSSALSVRRTYALLHITGEALLRFETSQARDIHVTLSPGALVITADAPPAPPDAIGPRLIETFARELSGQVSWDDNTLTVSFS